MVVLLSPVLGSAGPLEEENSVAVGAPTLRFAPVGSCARAASPAVVGVSGAAVVDPGAPSWEERA